jgi:hypothetical protein
VQHIEGCLERREGKPDQPQTAEPNKSGECPFPFRLAGEKADEFCTHVHAGRELGGAWGLSDGRFVFISNE